MELFGCYQYENIFSCSLTFLLYQFCRMVWVMRDITVLHTKREDAKHQNDGCHDFFPLHR